MYKNPTSDSADEKGIQPYAPIDWSAVRTGLADAHRRSEAVLNPSPERVAEILGERARDLAREKDPVKTLQWRQLTLFEFGSQPFAIETCYLRGVAHGGEITPLPETPAHLLGVTSYKGDIVAVIDPALLLGQQAVSRDNGATLLLLGEQHLEFALLVSTVAGQLAVDSDDIRPLQGAAGGTTTDTATANSLVLGLMTNAGSTRATTVLDGAALLADERLYFTV